MYRFLALEHIPLLSVFDSKFVDVEALKQYDNANDPENRQLNEMASIKLKNH